MLLGGLRRWYAFSEGPTEIPIVWKTFAARLPLPSQIDGRTYGAMCAADMAGERFEYMCAAEVATFDGLPIDLGRMRVPEAHYAVFGHEGPVWSVRETITAAHSWLSSNGTWTDAGTPEFERYGPRFNPETGLGDTEIWFPVTLA